MFAAIQLPVADVRALLPSTGRILSPDWPNPSPYREFIRSVGGVLPRLRGGDSNWAGEAYFCKASRALRLPPDNQALRRAFGSDFVTFEFRRFYTDGMAGRFEVGISDRPPARASAKSTMRTAHAGQRLMKIANTSLALRVSVPSGPRVFSECELVEADTSLARHLLRSTTTVAASKISPPSEWWLTPGRPLVLIETPSDKVPHPKFTEPVETLREYGISLSSSTLSRRGRFATVWFVGVRPGSDQQVLRHLRINLFRLHCERECLRTVLRYVADKRIPVVRGSEESDRLQRYLDRTFNIFFAKQRYGMDQSFILEAAYKFDDIVSAGERTALRERLQEVRGNIQRKVDMMSTSKVDQSSPRIVYYIGNASFDRGAGGIVEQNIDIGSVGGNITGSFLVDSSISDSFKNIEKADASNELKEKLTQLTAQVAELCKVLPEAQAETTARDLKSFTEEATTKNPRKSRLEVFGEGLREVAETVKDIGGPVVALVAAVIALF